MLRKTIRKPRDTHTPFPFFSPLQDGIFILIPHFLAALELILPDATPRFKGHEMISHVELRRSAIHLLLSMLCLPLHFRDLPLNDITATAFLTADGDFHSASASSFFVKDGGGDGSAAVDAADGTFSGLKLKLVNLLIQALHTETDSVNIHMLLGGLLVIVQDSAIFESVSPQNDDEDDDGNDGGNDGDLSANHENINRNNGKNDNGNSRSSAAVAETSSTRSSVSIDIPGRAASLSASTYSSASRPTSSSADHFDADFLNPHRPSTTAASSSSRPTRGSSYSGSSPMLPHPGGGGGGSGSRVSFSQQPSVFYESQVNFSIFDWPDFPSLSSNQNVICIKQTVEFSRAMSHQIEEMKRKLIRNNQIHDSCVT